MKENFIYILFFLLLNCCVISAQRVIKIGLFKSSKIDAIEIRNDEEQVFLVADNFHFTIPIKSILKITSKENNIVLSLGKTQLGTFKKIEIDVNESSAVALKPIFPDYPGNKYTENLVIKSVQNKLSIINKISMKNYLVGVLRGEIGYDKPFNSYLVMAIIAQTYAEGYFTKHRSEGFNLCDQTHCQVFKGFFKYSPYHRAAELAKNKIIVDKDGNIIEGLFHSNCGGITQNSENVWKNELPYCKSIVDTFCRNQKNSNWQRIMSIPDFCAKLNIAISSDSSFYSQFCNSVLFTNENRKKEITILNKKLNTVYIRTQLNLKSDWFELNCKGDSVQIDGKGFGHGVGLCQEGCIYMAEQGCNEEEIINFYFNEVIIFDRNKNKTNN